MSRKAITNQLQILLTSLISLAVIGAYTVPSTLYAQGTDEEVDPGFTRDFCQLRDLSPTACEERMRQLGIDFVDPGGSCSVAAAGSGGSANLDVNPDFSLGTDPLERRVALLRTLMTDYGLTAEQAAGPVGNFMVESAGTATIAAGLPPDVNQGDTEGAPPKFSGGYGWAQWTGSRQVTFMEYAVENNYMSNWGEHATDAANYAYLKNELNGGYQETITELKKQLTPEAAAVSFEDTFEKAGQPVLDQRTAKARQVFEEHRNRGSGSGSTSSGAVGCARAGNAAIVGDYAFPLITTKSEIENPGMFRDGDTDLGGHPYTAYDIIVPTGTEVAAFLSGTVVRVTEDRCPGRMISIHNEESDITVSYLHLSFGDHVGLGDQVAVGERVGLVGTTQNGCTIPHLHIDAVTGSSRPGCSRLSCTQANKNRFITIGQQLFETFQALPE